MSEIKEQKIPKWFDGSVYTEGSEVRNPFSGETYELNAIELSMYDFIMGSQHVFALHQETQPNKDIDKKLINDFDKALSWFKTNNTKAYMVLLD